MTNTFKKILEKIKENEFASNIIKLTGGTAVGQLIMLLVSPILTRLYSSEDFGLLAVYVSIAGILSVMIALRLELAVVLPADEDEAADLTIVGIFVSLIFSLFLFLIFLLFYEYINQLLGYSNLGYYLLIIPLSTFFYGSYQVLSYWKTRKKRYNILAVSKTVKESSTALIQVSLATITPSLNALGLIAGQIIGNATAACFLYIHAFQQLKQRMTKGILKNLTSVLKKYRHFPVYTGSATLINSISQNIPALLFAVLYSAETAGFYAVATRVITAPSILIGNSVRQVFFQKASESYNQGHQILSFYLKTTLQLALLAVLPLGIVIIWGEPLFLLIFGEPWGEAGIYASILSFWIFFGFINPPSMVSLFILKLNNLHLVWEGLLLIFRFLSILAGYWLFNHVLYSLVFFTISGILFNIILIGGIYFLLRKKQMIAKRNVQRQS